VAFYSEATNFVAGDDNAAADVFVRDRRGGTTELVSAAVGGGVGNASSASSPRISSNGRFVVFDSEASNLVPGDTNGVVDVFVRDLVANTTHRVSVGARGAEANAYSGFSVLSRDGRHVVFLSEASNLVRGDTNDQVDAFVRSRW
jgi:Tol biopolymer transport system component